MTIEYKPVHPDAKESHSKPSKAIAMRLHGDSYDQPIDPTKNYPCVTFDLTVYGASEIRALIDSIIADHGRVMVYRPLDGGATIWRIA